MWQFQPFRTFCLAGQGPDCVFSHSVMSQTRIMILNYWESLLSHEVGLSDCPPHLLCQLEAIKVHSSTTLELRLTVFTGQSPRGGHTQNCLLKAKLLWYIYLTFISLKEDFTTMLRNPFCIPFSPQWLCRGISNLQKMDIYWFPVEFHSFLRVSHIIINRSHQHVIWTKNF